MHSSLSVSRVTLMICYPLKIYVVEQPNLNGSFKVLEKQYKMVVLLISQ
jgi:hypothetical protein